MNNRHRAVKRARKHRRLKRLRRWRLKLKTVNISSIGVDILSRLEINVTKDGLQVESLPEARFIGMEEKSEELLAMLRARDVAEAAQATINRGLNIISATAGIPKRLLTRPFTIKGHYNNER